MLEYDGIGDGDSMIEFDFVLNVSNFAGGHGLSRCAQRDCDTRCFEVFVDWRGQMAIQVVEKLERRLASEREEILLFP